ncbi:unnamed protein product [Brachionus calyciflorus]|uniref:Uncharacterized protein n=1 Tax=Brachionus calyciflorus TaxID=104777 RepID=A0A813XBD7_9BILA|nr:unnamed protein product [Brachionus calyciflorus]
MDSKIDETENEETNSSLSIEEIEDLILFAKNKFINTDEDKRDIRDAMKNQNRLKWIKNCNPSLTEIFDKYPKYFEMHYLINDDFKNMFEDKNNKLISSWSFSFVNRLVIYGQSLNDAKVSQLLSIYNTCTDLDEYDNLRNFMHCDRFPKSKGNKNSKVSKYQMIDYVLQRFKLGVSVEEIINKCNSVTNQPIIVIVIVI